MKYKLNTYWSLTGSKKILEIPNKRAGQWIIYQDNEPSYYVDCFDFESDSNLVLNNLILSERKSIGEVLKRIKKKKNIDLCLPKTPLFEIQLSSEEKELHLRPLPLEWVSS